MDNSFLQGRIDATKASILAAEAAELVLEQDLIQSYTMDTGQSRQVAVRLNITEVRRLIDSLYNRCATLEARLNGSGVVTARPAF